MRRKLLSPWLCSSSAAAFVLLAASQAFAFERQWHAGVDAGYANLFGDNSAGGFGGGGHLAYGLSDAFNAMLELDVTRQPSAGTTIWSSGLGAAYTLDIARVVPYIGALGGFYGLQGNPALKGPAFGGQFAFGLDYLLERSWALGVQFRVHTIFAAGDAGTLAYATTFLRAEYIWGF
ncbi:MAG TPA: outer membrane beta-barrel protein [Polyangiaceae bacterium]|nr:outer membrane beta-barrel protein [Polyangiaceae bacterium]